MFVNIPSTEILTTVDNGTFLPVLKLPLSGGLNACRSEGISQNIQLVCAESPEIAINSNAKAVDGIAAVNTDLAQMQFTR